MAHLDLVLSRRVTPDPDGVDVVLHVAQHVHERLRQLLHEAVQNIHNPLKRIPDVHLICLLDHVLTPYRSARSRHERHI